MTVSRDIHIAIAGGGIAGLTLALSLHKLGFKATVFEGAPELRPLGVGINLLPHAMRELTALDLLNDLKTIGVEIEDLFYLTKRGVHIWEEPRGLKAGYKWPQIAIHRGDFQMYLYEKVLERLGPDSVRTGARVTDVTTHDNGANFALAGVYGEAFGERHADLLIACDGIHSAVRKTFYPNEGPPLWNRRILWRSTSVTRPVMGGRAMIWAGHASQKFVGYPIKYDPATGETLLNWICELRMDDEHALDREDWNRKGDKADFLPRFEGWRWEGVDVPDLVNSSGDIYEFPMVDRDPLPRWTFGRTTLLGDAAHAMYPIGSNGATQGIIDARVFAWRLATANTIEEALSLYENERRPATGRIVEMNRKEGPDGVMELAEQRAPQARGEADLEAVLPLSERQEIADGYKKVAGFSPMVLNEQAPYEP